MKLLRYLALGLFLGFSSFSKGQENEREKHAVILSGDSDFRHIHSINHADSILSKNGYNTYIFDEDTRKNYDINGITTKKNLKDFFENLDVDKNDLFLMYFTGHGNRDATRQDTASTINMTWGEPLKPKTLDSFLENISPSKGVLLFTQCHSGEFGKKLGKENYIAVSTSSKDRSSYGNCFGDSFFGSLNEKDADKNNDGKISVLEAASYALSQDPHTPLYRDRKKLLFEERRESPSTILPFCNQPRINCEKSNSSETYLNNFQ